MYFLCHAFVVIISVCFVDFSNGHPISTTADTGVGVLWAVSAASVAVVAIALVMSACCFHWCRDWWRRKYGDFENFTNSDVEGAASVDTSEGIVNPVHGDAAIVIPPQLAIQINNNVQEDNNNGPISPQELENIENNNAATYIVSENEDRNSLSPELRAREATARPLVRDVHEQDNRAVVIVQIETPPMVSPNRTRVESIPGPRNAELPIRAIAGTSNGVTLNCDILDRDWFSSPLDDFPRNHLKYLREIGKGWFGTIVEAEARTPQLNDPSKLTKRVAVKILNQNVTQEDKRTFLSEGRLYRDVKHRNVLTLIGKNLSEEPWLMIYEMCSLGDLKQYLWTNKPKMASLNENGIPLRLQNEVADALAYIHSNGLVHTDVACRTVLLAADPSGDAGSVHARLGDYGDSVSRHPEEYCTNGGLALPVRWCAPEALRTTTTDIVPNKLEPSADIWSLGIFLWEVCSWGQLPYQDTSNDEVITALASATQTGILSLHLAEPDIPCPYRSYLYQIMEMCWNVNPEDRPSALQVHELLSHLLEHHNQIYSAQSHWRESSVDDFESRWRTLKPNSVDDQVLKEVNIQPHLEISEANSECRSGQNGLYDIDPRSRATHSEKVGEKSPNSNRYWFKKQRDDRSEEIDKSIEMVPWLKGVPMTCQEDISYMETVNNVITDLDNILSSEKTSSTESSHQTSPHRDSLPVSLNDEPNNKDENKFKETCEGTVISPLDFRLGYESQGASPGNKPHPIFETDHGPSANGDMFDSKSSITPSILNVKFGYDDKSGFYDTQRVYYSSGSETEDETWKKRVEMGVLTEKVKMKSKSVTDLMVLTHIDTVDLESDSTPFNSLDFRINSYDGAYPTDKSKNDCQTQEKLFKRHFSLVSEWRGSESLRPEIDLLKVKRNACNWRMKNLRPVASLNSLSQLTKNSSIRELEEFKLKMDNFFLSANLKIKSPPNITNGNPLDVSEESNNKIGANDKSAEKCNEDTKTRCQPEMQNENDDSFSCPNDSFNSTSYMEIPDSPNKIISVLVTEIDQKERLKAGNLSKCNSDSDICLKKSENRPTTLNKSIDLVNELCVRSATSADAECFSREQDTHETTTNFNFDVHLGKSKELDECLKPMDLESSKSESYENERHIQRTVNLNSHLNGAGDFVNERLVPVPLLNSNEDYIHPPTAFTKYVETSVCNENDSLNSTSYLEIPDKLENNSEFSPDIVNVGFVGPEDLYHVENSECNNYNPKQASFNLIKLEQMAVSDAVIQKCVDKDWTPKPSDSSVTIGPFEECTLELYSGLKTDTDRLNPEYLSEDEALAFSSNFTMLNNEIRKNILNEQQNKSPIDVWRSSDAFAHPLAQSSPQIYDDLPYDELDLMQQQFTSKLAIAENENNMNIEHSSPALGNEEMTDGSSLHEDNERSDRSSNCSRNSQSENSYRDGFDVDDERVKILRNELEMKLPLAQAYNEHVMGEMSDDSDSGQFALDDGLIGANCYINDAQNGLAVEPIIDELSSEQNLCKGKINEVLIEYPNYNSAALSPIIEETYSDMSEYGQKPVTEQQKQELSASSCVRHIQSSKISELSKKCSDKQQNHGKSATIDSWCSNDTLFNVEDNFDDYSPTPSRETPIAESSAENRASLSPHSDEGDSDSTYLIEDRFVDSRHPTEINVFDDKDGEKGDSDTFAVGESIRQIGPEESCPSGADENKTYIIDSKDNIHESGIHSDMTQAASVFQTDSQRRAAPEKMREGRVRSLKFDRMDSLNSADVFIDSQFEFLDVDDANDARKPSKFNEKLAFKETAFKSSETGDRIAPSAEIAGINSYDDFVSSLNQDLMSTLHSSYNQFEASALTKEQDTGRINKGYLENSITESNCSSNNYLDNEVIAGVSFGYLEFVDSASKRQQNSEISIPEDATKNSTNPVVLNCTDNLDAIINSRELNPYLLSAKTNGSNSSASMEWNTFNSHEHRRDEIVSVKENAVGPVLEHHQSNTEIEASDEKADKASDSSGRSPSLLNCAFIDSNSSADKSGSSCISPAVQSPDDDLEDTASKKTKLENEDAISSDWPLLESLIREDLSLNPLLRDGSGSRPNEEIKSDDFNLNNSSSSSSQLYSAINNLFLLREKSSCNSSPRGSYPGISGDDLMTTSFSQESPTNEDSKLPGKIEQQVNDNFSSVNNVKEWESETDDSHSNSSEDFVWKKLQQSAMNKDGTILEMDEDNSDDDYDEDGEENDFTPSSWNCNAIPSKSSMKSPETSQSDNKKHVAFKEEKFQNVYEYPREVNTPEDELEPYITYYQPDYSNYSDWKSTDNNDIISSEQLVNPIAVDFQYTMPLSSLVDMSFMTSLPMYDGFESYSLNHSTSQFFPGGQNQDVRVVDESGAEDAIESDQKMEELEVEGFITPDSGMEDLSSGSPLAMNADADVKEKSREPSEAKQRERSSGLKIQLPKQTISNESRAPNSPSPSSGSNSPLSPRTLGELRHTREKLKLNLPSSPLKK